jgi:LysM repeat protein
LEKLLISVLTMLCVLQGTQSQTYSPHQSRSTDLLVSRSDASFYFEMKDETPGSATMDPSALSSASVRLTGLSIPVPEHLQLGRPLISPLPAYYWISEDVKIDCVWVDDFEYYGVWNSQKLNPYGFDGLEMTDTIQLNLFDYTQRNKYTSPLKMTTITSDFGLRKAQWHYGTDIRLKVGDPVYAPFDGIVRIAQYERHGFGRYVVLRHRNGLETLYGHLSKTTIKVGDVVKSGDIIAYGGNTGRSTAPHLHFEIRYEGNAIDPNELIDFSTTSLKDSVFTIAPASFAYLEEARAIRHVVVRRGDTLSEIGVKYGVSVGKLCYLNGISRKSILRIGQKLRIN